MTLQGDAVPTAVMRSRLRVAEGSCLDCAGDVAGTLRQLTGVRDVEVLASSGVIIVDHDTTVDLEAVNERAGRLGVVLVAAATRLKRRERAWWREPKQLALALAALLVLAGLLVENAVGRETLAEGLYWAAVAVGGIYPARSGLRALRTGRLTISTLLVAAALGALVLGVIEEAALLVVVFSLGEVLEDYASDRARGSIRALMALTPPSAERRRLDGGLETVAVEELVPGDVFATHPGERLATDGEVVAGVSAVDQSPVTGESMPVEVGSGSAVFGGTVNGTGALDVRVTKPYADTTLARIIRQVEEAQAHRGQAQRFADRFGAVFTPAMFGLALAVAVGGLALGSDPRGWVYRALVVLTVSCSCALVISVPVSVVAAISRAARSGILVKGGAYLEALGRVRTVAFDKTGTLTIGRPELTDAVSVDGCSPDEVLRLAAAVEAVSEHPLAGAIVGAAKARGVAVPAAVEVRALPGQGVEGRVDDARVFVGRPSPARQGDVARHVDELESQGKTVVVVTRGDQPIGMLAVADQARAEALPAIAALERLGIRRLIMLSGDNERVARALAGQLGISEWRAGLLPEDKTAAVRDLRQADGLIAMVGDGINDAPALASADVGIAMGAIGTDVALETADVALMADDLTKLPDAIRLSRHALANLRQNIALSLAAIAVLVIAALAGRLSLTSGLLLNEATALLIIANGLRLLRPSSATTRAVA